MKKFEKIHLRALGVAKKYREAEAEMLVVLQEVDREKVFLRRGFSSLFKYAEHGLKLSPINAAEFIIVARKAVGIPQVLTAVKDHRITVAKARRICPVINPKNAADWILKAETMTHRELEREVAKANPSAKKPDRARYTSDTIIELRFEVEEYTAKKLDRAQDLVSQRLQKAATYEDTLNFTLDEFLEREEPLNADALGTVPRAARKAALARDSHRCTFTAPDGRRCESRRWLDVHHIVPRSKGGSDDPENLRTLCSAHHRLMHEHSTLYKESTARRAETSSASP